MADELLFPGVPRPQGYVPTPPTVYDYANYGEWWKSKWTGPAWCCPQGHQMPQAKFDWGLYGGNLYGTFCPGCGRWVDRKEMKWDPTERKRTMGYVARKSQLEEDIEEAEKDERDDKAVPAGDKVSARRAARKQRGTGYSPGKSLDSGKNRRRKSKRLVGSGS